MRAKTLSLLALVSILLSACVLGPRATPTPAPTATLPPIPTTIPTPSQPLAVLVLPADMEKAVSDSYQKTVYELAQQAGMRFQVRNSFAAADMEPGLKIVIALPPDPGIAALAKAAPTVQFLAVDIPGLTAGANVSVLASNSQVDIPAFVAGYTAAMISDDHRAGMILPKDDVTANQAAQAFANGAAYYCGLCGSLLLYSDQNGHALSFPQFVQIPTDEDPRNFGGWANYLVGNLKVDAAYLYPDPKIAVKQMYDALGQTGVLSMGVLIPDTKPVGWVMEIRPDAQKAIVKAWPDLMAGKGGQAVPSPLGLADIDPSFLTPGKQRLVEQVLNDLQAGRIVTGVGQ